MQTRTCLVICLAATSFALATPPSRAEHDKMMMQLSANEIIGKKVINNQNEDLGKVQDLIVNVDSGKVPYAVIGSGFGGRHKVAVPLESLQCSSDGKTFTLSASKDDLKTATKSPQGRWAVTEDAEWTRSVDGYYGQPRGGFFRQPTGRDGGRVYTQEPPPKGAERLIQPNDRALCEKICDAIENVQVDVDNGVAQLYGAVENDTARQNVEAKVRSVPGVQRVESHLKVRNP